MNKQTNNSVARCTACTERLSWKRALGMLAGAPWRLHHYRDVRTQMLRDALCEIDCSTSQTSVND
jgi:hypothetical protein